MLAWRRRRVSVVWLVVALMLLAVLWRVWLGQWLWQQDRGQVDIGDYVLYAIGAEHLATTGRLDNSVFLVRPPLLPTVIWALNHDERALLLLNVVLGGSVVGLVYAVGRRLGLDAWRALAASAIVAADPLGSRYGAAILDAIPWGVFGNTAMIALLLAAAWARSPRAQVGQAALAALAFALALYARPEGQLVWAGLAVWLVLVRRHVWRALALYALLCALSVATWTLHNAQVFATPSFSAVAAYTLLYYRAAAVERLATGDEVALVFTRLTQRVEAALGRDPAAVTDDTRWGYVSGTPTVQRALLRVSFDVFAAHPLAYGLTGGLGALRLYGLATPLVEGARTPGAWALWAWNTALVGAAAVGLVRAAWARRWTLLWGVLLVLGYFTGVTLAIKSAALEGRERVMLVGFLALAATAATLRRPAPRADA